MTSAIASAAVAADFRESLGDLQANNRYEISNLTIIAKENAECAMAISRELENHIKTTPANRKLPALYVLDSIIKNVGTPYTLYLGRNLYSTFMEAYARVDDATRKNMESMLNTWKEPVPGSLEGRPVFPVDTTRPIATALAKAKLAFQQQAQQHQQQQQQAQQQRTYGALPPRPHLQGQQVWRNTPTPPQNDARFQPPPMQNVMGLPGLLSQQSLPAQNAGYQQQQQQQYQQQQQDLSWLQNLETLIADANSDVAINPYDMAKRTKLKALQDLQLVLRTQQLSQAQLQSIKDQIHHLTQQARQPAYQMPAVPIPPPTPQMFQTQPPPAANPYSTPPPMAQAPMSSTNLAALLASADAARRGTPPVSQPTPPPQNPYVPPAPAAGAGSTDTTSLFAALTAAGLLTSNSAPAASTSTTPQLAAASLATLTMPRNDVQLNVASLKVPRPHLVDSLYAAQPNQCTTCGRRFLNTDAGRAKKAKHLDFHFDTNQRLAEANKRGINRSWYMDELEWIGYREVDDGKETGATAVGASVGGIGGSAAADTTADGTASDSAKKTPYIRAPADAALARAPCPICQDHFQTTWHDEAQEWVWMDAVQVGGRVYHASCRDEVIRDGPASGSVSAPGQTAASVARPSSVLGKRKAEDEFGGSRLKRELVA